MASTNHCDSATPSSASVADLGDFSTSRRREDHSLFNAVLLQPWWRSRVCLVRSKANPRSACCYDSGVCMSTVLRLIPERPGLDKAGFRITKSIHQKRGVSSPICGQNLIRRVSDQLNNVSEQPTHLNLHMKPHARGRLFLTALRSSHSAASLSRKCALLARLFT